MNNTTLCKEMVGKKVDLEVIEIKSKGLNEQGEEFYLEKCKAQNRYDIINEFMGYSRKNKIKVYHSFDTLHSEDKEKFGEYFCRKKDFSEAEDFKLFKKNFYENPRWIDNFSKTTILGFDFFVNVNKFEKENEKYNLYFRQEDFLKDGFNLIFYEDSKHECKDHQEHWVEINENIQIFHPKSVDEILSFFSKKGVHLSLLDKLEGEIINLRKENSEKKEQRRRVF